MVIDIDIQKYISKTNTTIAQSVQPFVIHHLNARSFFYSFSMTIHDYYIQSSISVHFILVGKISYNYCI